MIRREDGFTMIEVMVAMAIAIVVIGAVATLFTTGQSAALATQRQNELIAVAQQQIEQLRQSVKVNGFSALAMSAAPTVSIDVTNPDYYVTDAAKSYYIASNWNDPAGTAAPSAAGIASYAAAPTPGAEPLCVAPAGVASKDPVPVTDGSNSVQVWTFVTQTTVGVTPTVGTPCADDARRVVVAVKFVNPGTRKDQGPNTPMYLSTIFTNPVPASQANGAVGVSLGVGGINLG